MGEGSLERANEGPKLVISDKSESGLRYRETGLRSITTVGGGEYYFNREDT